MSLPALPGLSQEKARELSQRGIRTRAQLRGVMDELPPAARAELKYAPRTSIPLRVALNIGNRLRKCLELGPGPSGRTRALSPACIHIVGSARRQKPLLKDLDLLLVAPDAMKPQLPVLLTRLRLKAGTRGLRILESYAQGERRRSFVVRATVGQQTANYRVDVFLAFQAVKAFALFHQTGSDRYSIRIRAHVKRKGWKLTQYGLFFQSAPDKWVPGARGIKTERQLAEFLGVSYRAPTDRER